MRNIVHIAFGVALAFVDCRRPDRSPTGIADTTRAANMTSGQMTVIIGSTRKFTPDGTLAATLASPRVTLDAGGDVVSEERLSTAGTVEARKQFAGGKLVQEERFTADGKLDVRLIYSYDASGHLAEEAMTLGGVTLYGKWLHHRDDKHRLGGRDFVKPDGMTEATETYTYSSDGKSATMQRAGVGQWKYRYDDDGRVLHEQGGPYSGDDSDQLAIDYEYDARHRLVSEIAHGPGGRVQRELKIAY